MKPTIRSTQRYTSNGTAAARGFTLNKTTVCIFSKTVACTASRTSQNLSGVNFTNIYEALKTLQPRNLLQALWLCMVTPVTGVATTFTSNSAGDVFTSQSSSQGSRIMVLQGAPLYEYAKQRLAKEETTSADANNTDKLNPLPTAGTVLAKTGQSIAMGINNNGQYLGQRSNVLGKSISPASYVSAQLFAPGNNGNGWLYSIWNTEAELLATSGLSAISQLHLERESKTWQANLQQSQMLDTSGIDGLFNVGASFTSPWESAMFLERMPNELTQIWNHPDTESAESPKNSPLAQQLAAIRSTNEFNLRVSNPLRYGYLVELRDAHKASSSDFVRHYTTGRMGFGSAVLMPDGKTLYRNDSASGYLFKLTTDFQHNLASGTLYYAAGLANLSKPGLNLKWVKLASGNNEEIAAWVSEYEGMTSDDYIEGRTSFINEDDISRWLETRIGQDLNADGQVETNIDNRVVFFEPVKAANALSAVIAEATAKNASADDSIANHLTLSVAGLTSSQGALLIAQSTQNQLCMDFLSLPADSSGNVTHAQPVVLQSLGNTCDAEFKLTAHRGFLPSSSSVFASDGDSLYSMHY